MVQVYPLPYDSLAERDGVIIFLIDVAALSRLLFGRQREPSEILAIHDTAGEFLVAMSAGRNSSAVPEDDRNYVSLSEVSETSGWRYTLYVPRVRLERRIGAVTTTFLITMAGIVLVGGALVFLFVRVSYGPIHTLAHYVSSLGRGSGDETRRMDASRLRSQERSEPRDPHELAVIRYRFDEIHFRAEELQRRVDDASSAVEEYIVYRLLHGTASRADLALMNPVRRAHHLATKYHCVALLMVQGTDSADRLPAALSWFQSRFQDALRPLGRFSMGLEGIVLLLGFEFDDDDRLVELLEESRSEAERALDAAITIGVGGIKSDTHSLPDSYMEATAALDYRLVIGNRSVISYHSTEASNKDRFAFPTGPLDAVRIDLRSRDWAAAEAHVEEIAEELRQKRPSLAVARVVCFSVVDAVIETFASRGSIDRLDLSSVTRFETFDELLDSMVRECQRALRELGTTRALSPSGRCLVGYVEKHFADSNFQIQSVCERFSLSRTTVNRIFRQDLQQTPLEYINVLRQHRAKLLLRTTRMPIKQLVSAVGYQDTSNFIRKFRQVEGLTPGEYRKQFYDSIPED